MSYQEEKQVRLRRQITKQAINLAMEGNWQESININKQLLENFPNDVEAYNRLGKAYLELREYGLAEEAYTKALELDQYNLIAKKNLQRLSLIGGKASEEPMAPEKADPHVFIEETGKAAVMNLYQTAPQDTLIRMSAGDKISLKVVENVLAVENSRQEILGFVPAKYAQRLIKLMQGGNKYTAAVVSSSENTMSIIIRETFQDPSQVGQISFPSKRIEELPPYVSERMLHAELEEEEEELEGGFGEEEIEAPPELADEVAGDKEKWEEG